MSATLAVECRWDEAFVSGFPVLSRTFHGNRQNVVMAPNKKFWVLYVNGQILHTSANVVAVLKEADKVKA